MNIIFYFYLLVVCIKGGNDVYKNHILVLYNCKHSSRNQNPVPAIEITTVLLIYRRTACVFYQNF